MKNKNIEISKKDINEELSNNKDCYDKSLSLLLKEKDFKRNNYYESIAISFFTTLAFLISLSFIYYSLYIYEPPNSFIVLDENYRVLEEVPLNLDVKSEEDLNQWATESVTKIFSYNYINFDKHGGSIKNMFTENSYKVFMELFNNLRLQKKIQVQKAIVEPVVLKAIKVEQSGGAGERKAWQMTGVILLNIHGKDGLERKKYNVNIVIVRTTFKENREGVVIQKVQLT